VSTPELDDCEQREAPITEEIGSLLDERAALACDPKREKFTLKQIAARHNVEL
jgi:hypothetical protein